VPYCRKCGAKLDDNARFCRICGTPVAPYAKQVAPAPAGRQVRRTSFPLAAIAAIIVAVLVVVALIVAFLPFQPVNFSQTDEASAANVGTIRLDVNAEWANVRILLRDLPGNQRAATNVSATGWKGFFGAEKPLLLAFNKSIDNSTLTYSVSVKVAEGWLIPNSLNVICDVYVDPSVNLDVAVLTKTGSIVMNANTSATFRKLTLEATAGNVVMNSNEDVVVSGPLWLQTTTGSVIFGWDDAEISGNIPVSLKATTGSVEVSITQTRRMQGNVTLDVEVTTGNIDLTTAIENDIGARISATITTGGVNVQQNGFSGNNSPLQSENYPAGGNFDVTLKSTTGGINIDANYELGGTRT
jgi:hypothetical protein